MEISFEEGMKKMFRNINWTVFIITAVVISILVLLVLFNMMGDRVGINEKISPTFPKIIIILGFPFLLIVGKLPFQVNVFFYLIAFLLDILLYAFLFERICTFFKRRKKIED